MPLSLVPRDRAHGQPRGTIVKTFDDRPVSRQLEHRAARGAWTTDHFFFAGAAGFAVLFARSQSSTFTGVVVLGNWTSY